MKTCIDKTCEAVLCEECNDLKPSMCGDRGLQFPKDACDVITFEGVEDVETKQGLCVDLTEGVHAYDGDGTEISYTVEPSEIGCCDVGEHEVTYTAVGKGNKMLPSFCLGKPMLTTADCGLMTKVVTRLVTILQSLPPKIIGAVRTVIPVGATFDPLEGVSGIDDNGKETEVTYEGRYDETTGMVDIASVESDIDQNAKHLYVELEPIQEGTPWMDTDVYTEPYKFKASPQLSEEYNAEDNKIVGGTVAWNQLTQNGDFTLDSDWSAYNNGAYATYTREDGVGKVVVNTVPNATYFVMLQNYDDSSYGSLVKAINGHKYLYSADVKASKSMVMRVLNSNGGSSTDKNCNAETWTAISGINIASRALMYMGIQPRYVDDLEAGLTFYVRNVINVDLTQMFGSTIADYIYSLEQANAGAGVAWFKKLFPNDYYPYDSGTLKSVEGLSAHVMKDANGNVIGNYPLDNSLTLRGIPKLDSSNNLYYDGDEYASDGIVTRKYGVVDLGTLVWGYTTAYSRGVFYAQLGNRKKYSTTIYPNFICTKYLSSDAVVPSDLAKKGDKLIGATTGSTQILITDDSYSDRDTFKTAMSGVYLVYELATPTTETAEAYTNPQSVEPYGTEEYVTDSIVPVGHKTRYMRIAPISGYTEVDTFVSPTTSETDATKYTTQLGQTVYGGTLDVVSGELVVNKGYIASYNGETLPSTWISDRDVYASGTTPTIGAEVVYELAKPQTYQLTPQEIRLLLGTNNIWSEDGKVEVVYTKAISGETQFDIEGVYTIYYHTEDECGNETTVKRYLIVGECDTEQAEPVLCKGKMCCATLDCSANYLVTCTGTVCDGRVGCPSSEPTICNGKICSAKLSCTQTEITPIEV